MVSSTINALKFKFLKLEYMNVLRTVCFLLISLVLTSFNPMAPSSDAHVMGNYGICGAAYSSHSSLRLRLNSDHTFLYSEKVGKGEFISGSGTWTFRNSKLSLSNIKPEVKMPLVWHADSDNTYLKARRGATYYRICKLQSGE